MIKITLKALFILSFFFLVLQTDVTGTTITADNPNFYYVGRINYSIMESPVMYWPGTYIKAKFEGTSLTVVLDDSTGLSFFDIYIDEDYNHPFLIDCKKGNNKYLVSSTLTDTIHGLVIFRRTEASTGSTKFLGIELDEGKNLIDPGAELQRKILFYGDSITCGYGDEAPDSYADDNLKYENNFLAYGAVASRLLNADYMCIAKSGIGLMKSFFNMVMPEYYYRLDPDRAESQWDFNLFVPDVVVINIMQNDSWLLGSRDSATITNTYANFVREIRGHHQNAFIVCALGSMDATKTGSPWPGYIKGAVESLKNNDQNIGTYFFSFDPSWTKHPRVRHQKNMGEKLAAYIAEKLEWTTDIENNFALKSPAHFQLKQNYPNPFNPSTTIEFYINKPGNVKLVVYDIMGNEIRTLVDEYKNAGSYKTVFNAVSLASGVYYYNLITGQSRETRPMIILK
jgi:lysophospholipase L1-like esterase